MRDGPDPLSLGPALEGNSAPGLEACGAAPCWPAVIPGTTSPSGAAPPLSQRPGIALAAGSALALLLTLPKTLQVLATGVFLNPDDAMRAVEVRDFTAGQGWFDLVPHRLSPDHPFAMHWSRLVDLPLSWLTRAFGLVLRPAAAEIAMRLAAPSLLFVAALALTIAVVRATAGPRAILPAALLMAGSAELLADFVPGHIHHHGVQVTLLLLAVRLIVAALRPGAGLAPAAGAGAAVAVSLGVGLQNLPFALGLVAIATLAWVAWGPAAARLLGGFGGALAASSCVVFLVEVPPASYATGACDAFSAAHLIAAGLGGALALLLAAATPYLTGTGARMGAALVAGLAVLGALAFTYPACLDDPMAGVDPLLRTRWLADVGEALPLARLIALDPAAGIALALTLACGVAATLGALAGAAPARRAPWAALLLLALIGVLGTTYQVRVAASACALAVPGVAWASLRCFDRLSATPGRPALLAATVVGLLGNGAAWSLATGTAARVLAPASAATRLGAGDPASCFLPSAYEPLAALPPGLVLSTIDPGSAILAATSHAVLAAPYHRNSFGNRAALLAFVAPPAEARAIVAEARATLIALCRASNEVAEDVALHPGGLAGALMAGRIPDWLEPIGTGDEPVLLFRVKT